MFENIRNKVRGGISTNTIKKPKESKQQEPATKAQKENFAKARDKFEQLIKNNKRKRLHSQKPIEVKKETEDKIKDKQQKAATILQKTSRRFLEKKNTKI